MSSLPLLLKPNNVLRWELVLLSRSLRFPAVALCGLGNSTKLRTSVPSRTATAKRGVFGADLYWKMRELDRDLLRPAALMIGMIYSDLQS